MNKFISYFFEEDEKELVQIYDYLLKLAIVTAIIAVLGVIA